MNMPFFKKSSSSSSKSPQPDQSTSTYQHPHHRSDLRLPESQGSHYYHPAHQESPRISIDTNTHTNTTRWPTSPSSITTSTDPVSNKVIHRDRDRDTRQVSSTTTTTKETLDFLDRTSSIRRHRLSPTDLQRKPLASSHGHGQTGGSIQRSNTDSSLEKTAPAATAISGVRQVHTLSERIPQNLPAGSGIPNTSQPLPSPSRASTMADVPGGLQPGSVHSSVKENTSTASTAGSTGEGSAKREDTGGGGGGGGGGEGSEGNGLRQKHDELQIKYSRVKRYYFEKEAQVQHLQNTVAHQRMAVSRTVLDDNEYTSRFLRLDGAIKDLAFSIRKSWTSVPGWLTGYTNDDAAAVGMKEMMAIGRAVVSRFLGEGVFGRYFHPGLDREFSNSLKGIEQTLRAQHQHHTDESTTTTTTDEDRENAHARISNWRRTTLDGLTPSLTSPSATENRSSLIDVLVSDLVSTLKPHLSDPPPEGLDAGVRMIIENSVSIAENIPLESRDVCVGYFLPGSVLDERVMRVETGVPPLKGSSIEGQTGGQRQEEDEDEDEETDSESETTAGSSPAKKKSVFSSLIKKPVPSKKDEDSAGDVNPNRSPTPGPGSAEKIRFATFLSVDVRGKGPGNVLAKAPVYVLE